MFIELTREYDGSKILFHMSAIKRIVPLKPEDGYGRPQKGSEIYLEGGAEATSRVKETYEEIREELRHMGIQIGGWE